MSASEPSSLPRAATVLVLRDRPAFEVLMVHRHPETEMVPGAMIFPGGKVDPADLDPAWSDHALGWASVPAEERDLRVAAVREVFEETGLLLARRGPGGPFVAEAADPAARRAVESGADTFLDYVRRRGLAIDLEGLVLFSRWRTPPIVPKRFDTFFFIVEAPPVQAAEADGRETVGIEWIAPRTALHLAAEGRRHVVLPTRLSLRTLAETDSVAAAAAAARVRRIEPIEVRLEQRDDGPHLVLDPRHGFGPIAEPFRPAALTRGKR